MKYMITGTGTLGTELVLQILKDNENEIVVMDHSEEALWRLQEVLRSKGLERSDVELRLGDIRDHDAVGSAMLGCEAVIHTAALKHVVLTNDNPRECLRTNVEGTLKVLTNAMDIPSVMSLVNVSSDKACMPSNIYGETKRMTETLTRWAAKVCGKKFFSCRFGNFLGSHGSVFDRWKEQRKTGAIVLTDPMMNRFFIKPYEVAKFILDGIEMEWDRGDVHIPYMKVLNMETLAEVVAEQWGTSVKTIGKMRGEKINEMLIGLDETRNTVMGVDFCITDHLVGQIQDEMITTAYMPALSKEETLKYIKEVIQ